MISPGINLVMTVIGFGLSITFIVFVCTRLICARIHLNASRRFFARAAAAGSDLTSLERGLEPITPANFPMKKYKELCLPSKENASHRCSVCLSDYQEEDSLYILPICGHFFHATCIGIWLQQHPTCPVCRVSIQRNKWFMHPMFSSALRSQHSMQAVNAHYCRCMGNNNAGRSSRRSTVDGEIVDVRCHSVDLGDRNSTVTVDCQRVSKNCESDRIVK
ncbi:hypothetical protein ABFS83_06G087200 [Erythranthe nasuta]